MIRWKDSIMKQSKKRYIVHKMDYVYSSDSVAINSELSNISSDDETLFWYYALYIIGDYLISALEQKNFTSGQSIDRIFFGYWILYNVQNFNSDNTVCP